MDIMEAIRIQKRAISPLAEAIAAPPYEMEVNPR